MRIRLLQFVLVLCMFAVAIETASAQPPYRRRLLTDMTQFTPAEQLELRQLIMNYLTAPVVALHLTPGIHNADEYFLSWHRGYINGLESWLMTQPNGSKYVPLPKYDPLQPVPGAFFNSLVLPGSAVVGGYPLLINQNPGISLAPLLTNPCQWTANGFGSAVDGPHGSVHVAIGGSMGATTTASAAAIFWPWHAFLDDMYRYYQCVCQNATGKDLYMKDDVKDFGIEPNTTAPNNVYNGSPDIWVRNTQDPYSVATGKYASEDDPTHYQNPVYNPLGQSYVYVRIRNTGCQRVNAGEVILHVYWSHYSTSASTWPTDWIGGVNGDEITLVPVAVPALDPGRQWVAEIPWTVPNPENYPNAPARYCLLARLVSAVDPMAVVEGSDVLTNVKNNNNLVWRNVDVVPADPYNCTPTPPCDKLYIAQVHGDATYDKIRFDYGYNDQYDYNPVYVEVDLGQDLYNVWRDGGYESYGIDNGQTDDYKVSITRPGAYLGNLQLTPGVKYDPCVRTYIKNPDYGGYGGYGGYDGYGDDAGYGGYGGYGGDGGGTYGGYGTYGGVYPVHVSQYESYGAEGEQPVGGATYEVRAVRDEVAVPPATYVLNEVITRPPCPESYTGSIQLATVNPAADYTYWWSNGQSTRDVYNLAPGTYNVVVRDKDDCAIDTREYVVAANSSLAIDMDSDLSHCSNSDGRARCGVTGGSAPYTYRWTRGGILLPGEIGPIVNNASPGEYTVTVTDKAGCTIRGTVNVINEWDMLTVDVTTTEASGPNTPDGTAQAHAHGMPELSYNWSNGATTAEVTGLAPGTYWVDATDMSGAGCTKRATFEIVYSQNGQSNGVERGSSAVANLTLAPNPASGSTELRYRLQRAGIVQIELYDNLGRRIDVLFGGHLTAGDQLLPIAADGLASGQYTVRILTGGTTSMVQLTVVH